MAFIFFLSDQKYSSVIFGLTTLNAFVNIYMLLPIAMHKRCRWTNALMWKIFVAGILVAAIESVDYAMLILDEFGLTSLLVRVIALA
jgi:hypothetical protein